MDDLLLDDAPPQAPDAEPNAPQTSPPNALENPSAGGAVAAAQAPDLWDLSLSPATATTESMVDPFTAGASVAGNPFDAFDAFAPPPPITMTLPPPSDAPSTTIPLDSPLISFSPVATTSSVGDVTATASASVNDLLSFSSVTAAPSSSSSLMTMNNLFLDVPASSSSSDAFSTTSHSQDTVLSPLEVSTMPPPAPFMASDTTTALRGNLSSLDAVTATTDVFTDYAAPLSAPAAFHDGGIVGDSEDAVFTDVVSIPSTKELEAVDTEPPAPTPTEPDLSTTSSHEELLPLEPVEAVEVEGHTMPLDAEQEIATHHQAHVEVDLHEVDARDSQEQDGHVQSPIEFPVLSESTSDVPVSSVPKSAFEETGEVALDDDGHWDDRDATEHPTLGSTLLHEVPLETESNNVEAAAVVLSPGATDGYEEADQEQDANHDPAATVADEEIGSQSYEVADDTSEVAFAEQELVRSTASGDIPSPSSVTQEFEGFQELSGDSSDDDDEAVTGYAEVNDSDDEISRDSVDAGESILHLHLRDIVGEPSAPIEDNVFSPASIASSTGSSVAGSAFAFISGGASPSFSFGQLAQSPSAEVSFSDSAEPKPQSCHESTISSFQVEQVDIERHSAEEVIEEAAVSSTNAITVEKPGDEAGGEGFGVFGAVDGTLGASDVTSNDVDDAKPSESFDFQSSTQVSTLAVEDTEGFGGFASGSAENDDDSGFTAFAKPVAAAGNDEGNHGFGGFESSTATDTTGDGFGGFGASTETHDEDDDGFGGFTQSAMNDEDDDFGDFGGGTGWGIAAFGSTSNDDDDDFGDFAPAQAPVADQWGSTPTPSQDNRPAESPGWGAPVETHPPAPTDLDEFFAVAFPASKAPFAASLLPKPSSFPALSSSTVSTSSVIEQANAVHKNFHASLQDYRSMLTSDDDDRHQQLQQPSFESEALRLKYLKYVLTEKLNEASRHDGVFPQGSEKYQIFEAIAESGNEKHMRDALRKLQEALFHSSMNEAVMRIARQAALSAKARIAEQAAQQQAHARGSLLATTRNFLARSAGSSSNDKDPAARTGSGVLTPTSASVQKGSRFPSSHSQDEAGYSSGYGSGEDTGSDVSLGDSSNYSEGDTSGGGSGPPSASSTSTRSGGGLMKKFHERFSSLSSTKNKPRTVSLRRMGQSSEEVCKMELNMESINGGFDEVKWRCAGFLYETEEVARLAPSQIKIYAYPSNQLLTGKTDRSALSKFFKPGTIWSIDIGVSTE